MKKAKPHLWGHVVTGTKKVTCVYESRAEAREYREEGETVKRIRKHGKTYRITGKG